MKQEDCENPRQLLFPSGLSPLHCHGGLASLCIFTLLFLADDFPNASRPNPTG